MNVRVALVTSAMVIAVIGGSAVTSFAVPANDACVAATVIGAAPFADVVDTTTATTAGGDPPQSCTAGGPSQNAKSVWYRFVAPSTGTITVDTLTSDYDTVLTAYTGSCAVLTEVGCNDDAATTTQSELAISVTAGTAYVFEVTSFGESGAGGSLRFALGYTAGALETVTQAVGGGMTVTTDTEGDGATPTDQLETTVTTPNAGAITITESPVITTSSADFTFLGQQVEVTAPAASAMMPLQITFVIDSTMVPTTEIQIFRNCTPTSCQALSPCTGGPGQAIPDPCVTAQSPSPPVPAGADVAITVLTSHASMWTFAGPTVPLLGKKLLITNPFDATKRKLIFVAKDSSIVTPNPNGIDDPTCAGSGGGGAMLAVFGTGGSNHGVKLPLPCANWTVIGDPAKRQGFKYKDSHQDHGPCKIVLLKRGKLAQAVCTGKNPTHPLSYELATGEGSVGVTLRVGGGLSYCAEFGGGLPIVTQDDGRAFKAKTALAPAACSALHTP